MSTITKTHQFNTGRGYTAQGQIIIVVLWDDGVVTFDDISRGIKGQIKFLYELREDHAVREWEVEHFVMQHYDSGLYVDLGPMENRREGVTM
jgi:hypothetical protein